jgi:hypothetical protein
MMPDFPLTVGSLTSTRRVIWLSEAEKGKGYAVDFLDITLHAVSRDLEAYPSPCLYTQVIGQANSLSSDTVVLAVELQRRPFYSLLRSNRMKD